MNQTRDTIPDLARALDEWNRSLCYEQERWLEQFIPQSSPDRLPGFADNSDLREFILGNPFPYTQPGWWFEGYPSDSDLDMPNIMTAGRHRTIYNQDREARGLARLPDDWEVHHRIPRVFGRYPERYPEFTDFDFDHPHNLRGVPGFDTGDNVHSRITVAWERFRRENPDATRSQIEDFANEIDAQYGHRYWEAND